MKRTDFCTEWRFHRNDDAGDAHIVDLPHDAMQEEIRDPDTPAGSSNAFFPGGCYVYEKAFDAPDDWAGKAVFLQFEGVYRNARVYINGVEAGGRPYGYIPFFVEAGSLLKLGQKNVVKVVADNSQVANSRWYTGGGIYRPVWLWTGEKSHIEPEGVRVSTLSYSPAHIRVEVAHTGGEPGIEILFGEKVVARGSGDSVELDIPDAKLWSDETPDLYECRVTLTEGKMTVDRASETFGIRQIEWNAQKGLLVNGKQTLLRGGCVHHDNGILGARSYAKAEERRVRLMKQNGFNAIRSAHNPASKAMLAACDRLGVYIIDETWDMWYGHKTRYDYATDFEDNYREDIEALVARDFNHPSVIMYSIGNEISEPSDARGLGVAREIIDLFHRLDANRAVTCGTNLMIMNLASKGMGLFKEDNSVMDRIDGNKKKKKKEKASGSLLFNMMMSIASPMMERLSNSKSTDKVCSPFLDMLDISGYNYAGGRYEKDGVIHPERVIYGSETMPYTIAKNWAMVKKHPYLIGDFMWTGWDYLGETGIGSWTYGEEGSGGFQKTYPWLLAEPGALDILGNPTGEMLRAAAVWNRLRAPAIGVRPVNHPGVRPATAIWRKSNAIPSWSWQNCDGNEAVVEVFFDAAEVELLLNGKSLGRAKCTDCLATFKTKYAPGTLTAVAYDAAGKEIARGELSSATGTVSIRAAAEEATAKTDEVAYVQIDLVGENGVVEANADTALTVTVEGGELLAFGSARPNTRESFLAGSYTTHYGRALAAICRKDPGKATVTVCGQGLPVVKASVVFE